MNLRNSIFDSVSNINRWHYLPPANIQPYTLDEMFEFVLSKLLDHD